MVAIKRHKPEINNVDEIEGVDILSAEEGRAYFDRRVRKLLGISGDEFLRRWDAGEYGPVPDTVEGRSLGRAVMLMPFAGRTIA